MSSNDTLESTFERFKACKEVVKREFLRRHSDPWVVAFSGGKDSTLLLHVIWEVLLELPPNKRLRELHVVGNDTLVESPLVINHLRDRMDEINAAAIEHKLPIKTHITRPNIDQTFWVNLIGRGYIPPTRNFRWCTDRMKIIPTTRLLEGLVQQFGRVVLLVGTRRSESENRRRTMDRNNVSSTRMNPHSSISNCRMFAPLADFSTDDVWITLMQRNPPWGGSHRDLITLYRTANGGECPLVLTAEDAPSCGTTSPRFGCWTCTVVAKDRSMRGVIDAGHRESVTLEKLFYFREWLVELRENNENRQSVRRDGSVKLRPDGSRVMGPFKLEVRKHIFKELRKLETEIGLNLLSQSECEVIEDIWRIDHVKESCREALSSLIEA